MSEVYIDRLLVIGVGLIGGSFAMALRNAGVVGEIVGAGRSQESLERGVELGVIDRYTLDFSNEVGKSDVIFVSTPVLATDFVFQKISLANYHNSVITDAGKCKRQYCPVCPLFLRLRCRRRWLPHRCLS